MAMDLALGLTSDSRRRNQHHAKPKAGDGAAQHEQARHRRAGARMRPQASGLG